MTIYEIYFQNVIYQCHIKYVRTAATKKLCLIITLMAKQCSKILYQMTNIYTTVPQWRTMCNREQYYASMLCCLVDLTLNVNWYSACTLVQQCKLRPDNKRTGFTTFIPGQSQLNGFHQIHFHSITYSGHYGYNFYKFEKAVIIKVEQNTEETAHWYLQTKISSCRVNYETDILQCKLQCMFFFVNITIKLTLQNRN